MLGPYESRPQLPCLICGAQLDEGNYGAVEFIATGNYGSTIWEMTGNLRLIGYAHDGCVTQHQKRVCCERVYTKEEHIRKQVSVQQALAGELDENEMSADQMLLGPPG